MKKIILSLCVAFIPLGVCGQVYHAGETVAADSSVSRWEVSAGVLRSNYQVRDRTGERMFKGEDALSVRAVYYPVRWLGIGVEGTWFDKENFVGDNSYKDTRYQLLTKWILTPDTRPHLYLLVGAGQRTQKVSYAHLLNHTKHNGYGLAALGVEVEITHGWFVAAEGQLTYFPHKEIDNFLRTNKNTERLLSVRTGVRF